MIKIRFFALLREVAKCEETTLNLPEGSSCEQALFLLQNRFPSLYPILSSCLLAVNSSYASPTTFLSDGDELALLPPVSGG